MRQSTYLLLTILSLIQISFSQPTSAYGNTAAAGGFSSSRNNPLVNYSQNGFGPANVRRTTQLRRGPNGEILSPYEAELQRQREVEQARQLLNNAIGQQGTFFQQRASNFQNQLNQANAIRERNFLRNQRKRFILFYVNFSFFEVN